MKKLILLGLFILTSFTVLAQTGQDTVKLTPQELFEFNSRWNNLGTTQSYIDFSKDVLSTSDISLGIVGERVSTTFNLAFNLSSSGGKWNHSVMTSINPSWKYYGIGYSITKKTSNRKTTLQIIGSSDFDFQTNINLSIIDLFTTNQFGNFGWSLTASQTFWGEWPGPWQGEYIVDSLGNWVSNIYPTMPSSRQLTTRAMIIYSYPIKTKLVTISPQLFVTSDIHRTFTDGTLNISYWSDFNLDIYYGVQLDWKIGSKFILNSSIRFNSSIDNYSTGFKKSNPILFSVGTGF